MKGYKWKHRLSNLDIQNRQAQCIICGPTGITVRRRLPDGRINWRCRTALRRTWFLRDTPYRVHLKSSCERCNFIPEASIQLEVHHKDHDHFNNIITNLQTLCANCHSLDRIGLL